MSAQEKFWFKSQQSELVAYLDDLLAQPQLLVEFPEPSVVLPFPLKKVAVATEAKVEVEVLQVVEQVRTPVETRLPDLSQYQELSCLYIVCDGMRYALPLIHLGRIFRAEQHLTPLVGQPVWQLGILPTQPIQQAISLHHVLTGQKGQAPRYYVSVALSRRVLACEAILNSERIRSDVVHWRQDRERMPLIAGVITESLVPLLDLSRLGDVLK